MNYKAGLLFVTLLVGSYALPMPEDDDYFFYQVDPSSRIVGGTEAAVGSHPHMVGLSTGLQVRSFLCGGSLISQRTVLTAAHCIAAAFSGGSLSSTLRGVVGTNRWNSGGTIFAFARNVTHPNYVSSTIKNDVGLLITSSNVAITNLVRPIPLSFASFDAPVNVRVAGWGRIRGGGALSATLLQVDLTTIRGQECVTRVRQASIDFNTNAPPVEPHIELCTFRAVNFGTCNGDSGSALARRDNGQQVGVVSWGFPCARGAPDMFARVSAFQNFINSNIV